MLFSLLGGEDLRMAIIQILLSLPIIIFALSWHEAAHGYVAYKFGDPTARNLGRLTLNPVKHLDPLGFISMLVFGFGWAKPVPIYPRNFENPKKGMAFSAIAGPAMNLILGIVSSLFYVVAYFLYVRLTLSGVLATELSQNIFGMLLIFLQLSALYNFMFMAFNLIPVPPFDGSRFVNLFLPADKYFAIMRYEKYFVLGVFAIVMILSNIFHFSPFSWVAYKLFDLIVEPLIKLGMSVML